MNFEYATRKQLLQVALHENCDIHHKYNAAHELQIRQWHDDYLPQLMSMWGQGKSVFDIAIEMEIPQSTVKSRLLKYGLFGKRVSA